MEQLAEFEKWFLEAVTGDAAAGEIEARVVPSGQQSAQERLGVYQQAYLARLVGVLQELFPCTRFAVGDDLFRPFAVGYIQAHPPRSYTLARLADKFADYLDQSRPADWGAFIVELVCLEQAIDRVFDAPGPEALPRFSLPNTADASSRLLLVPGYELHRFSYPVSEYFSDWKVGREPGWPASREQFVALLRRDYVVRRYELSAAQYALLSAIQRGAALAEAITAAADQSGDDVDSLVRQFHAWFQLWASERFFV